MQKRKNYFIKKKFQFNFFSKFVLLLLIESALIISLFMYLSADTLTTGFQNSILTVERTQSFFFIPFVFITLIIVIGISLCGIIVFTSIILLG